MKDIGVFQDDGKVDIELIRAFEKEMNISFPNSYVGLIRNHDYLFPVENCFNFTYEGQNDNRDIYFSGYKNRGYNPSNIFDSEINECNRNVFVNKIVEFGYCANGDFICFLYKDINKDPEIILMFHDLFYDDAVSENDRVIVFIADNFESFIDMLYSYDDEVS